MVNSIKKGKAFEREVSHLLSSLSCKKHIRVAHSGAMATTNKLKTLIGDVIAIDDLNNNTQTYVIECKVVSKLYPYLIKKWVNKTYNLPFFIFVKKNYKDIFVIVDDLLINTEMYRLLEANKIKLIKLSDLIKSNFGVKYE